MSNVAITEKQDKDLKLPLELHEITWIRTVYVEH